MMGSLREPDARWHRRCKRGGPHLRHISTFKPTLPMTITLHPSPSSRRRRSTSRDHARRLQDHLMLNIYGGISPDDLDRYQNQPETLAGLIATRTGRSREWVRAWLRSTLSPWR